MSDQSRHEAEKQDRHVDVRLVCDAQRAVDLEEAERGAWARKSWRDRPREKQMTGWGRRLN